MPCQAPPHPHCRSIHLLGYANQRPRDQLRHAHRLCPGEPRPRGSRRVGRARGGVHALARAPRLGPLRRPNRVARPPPRSGHAGVVVVGRESFVPKMWLKRQSSSPHGVLLGPNHSHDRADRGPRALFAVDARVSRQAANTCAVLDETSARAIVGAISRAVASCTAAEATRRPATRQKSPQGRPRGGGGHEAAGVFFFACHHHPSHGRTCACIGRGHASSDCGDDACGGRHDTRRPAGQRGGLAHPHRRRGHRRSGRRRQRDRDPARQGSVEKVSPKPPSRTELRSSRCTNTAIRGLERGRFVPSLLRSTPRTPLCSGHREPCILLAVGTPGPNRGKFGQAAAKMQILQLLTKPGN